MELFTRIYRVSITSEPKQATRIVPVIPAVTGDCTGNPDLDQTLKANRKTYKFALTLTTTL